MHSHITVRPTMDTVTMDTWVGDVLSSCDRLMRDGVTWVAWLANESLLLALGTDEELNWSLALCATVAPPHIIQTKYATESTYIDWGNTADHFLFFSYLMCWLSSEVCDITKFCLTILVAHLINNTMIIIIIIINIIITVDTFICQKKPEY